MKPAAAALAVALLSSQFAAGAVVAEGDVIPAASPVLLVDLHGRRVDLGSLLLSRARELGEGQGATLLVFWATWCQPCIHEIPDLKELHRYWGKKGLRVLGVALSWGGDTLERVAAAASSNGITYPVLFDDEDKARKTFGVKALPTSALIDAKGLVLWKGPLLPSDINDRIKGAIGPGEERGAK